MVFQYRSRSFLRNCSKANFLKTLVMPYSKKVDVIGTRFQLSQVNLIRVFKQNCIENLMEIAQKSKGNSTLIC